ncbi:MAG: YmdB family metallophosphoesterase, partial [Candidatus Latescibacteria bacterium]|nr:YmdB family metallophosphoesterase [Candidatus Latescibacterota bacterium]
MNILFVGDIYGKPGRRAASEQIPRLMVTRAVDFCIVNAENAAGGFGITEKIGQKVFAYGADVITMGNHVWDQRESVPYVKATERVLRPENFPAGVGGKGSGVFISRAGVPVGVVSLQGRTNMKPLDCPFQVGRETI